MTKWRFRGAADFRWGRGWWVATSLTFFTVTPTRAADGALSASAVTYIRELLADTWASLEYLRHKFSSLPYDSSKKSGQETSVSNLGLFFADEAIAVALGLETRVDAVSKCRRALESIRKF